MFFPQNHGRLRLHSIGRGRCWSVAQAESAGRWIRRHRADHHLHGAPHALLVGLRGLLVGRLLALVWFGLLVGFGLVGFGFGVGLLGLVWFVGWLVAWKQKHGGKGLK